MNKIIAHCRVKFQGSFFIVSLLIIFFICSLFFGENYSDAHFLYLAKSFSEGKLFLENFMNHTVLTGDVSVFGGKMFWPLGPLPALLYMPFVFLIQKFNAWNFQSYSVPIFTAINIFLFYILSRRLELTVNQALWMTFAFIFGTVYIGVAFFALNSYVSHAITTIWLLASLVEFFGKRRFWLIGFFMGLALATRFTAGLGIIFYIASIIGDPFIAEEKITSASVKKIIVQLAKLLAPFLIVLALLLVYNYLRFYDVFEFGYAYQGHLVKRIGGAIDVYGLRNIAHHLFIFFFGLPYLTYHANRELAFPYLWVNGQGTSIFITSPFIFSLLLAKFKKWLTIKLFITTFIIFLFLSTLYLDGNFQYGYRFSLDFLPYLMVILMYNISTKKIPLSDTLKFIIIIGALINLYLVGLAMFPIFFKDLVAIPLN